MIYSWTLSLRFAFGALQTAGTREHVAQLENPMITALISVESGQLTKEGIFSAPLIFCYYIQNGLSHEDLWSSLNRNHPYVKCVQRNLA